jgi:hypothetical protein
MSSTPGGKGCVERREPVAIVGIGCRFPGASGPGAFWKLLAGGVSTVSEIPADRLDVKALYDPRPGVPGRMATRWGGFLEDVDRFDAGFFQMSPREAERLDPQQRLLLEVTWEALEDAGSGAEGPLRPSDTSAEPGGSDIAAMRSRMGELPFDLLESWRRSGHPPAVTRLWLGQGEGVARLESPRAWH